MLRIMDFLGLGRQLSPDHLSVTAPSGSLLGHMRRVHWRLHRVVATLFSMPRWLVALIIILIIVVFILPNPAGTGTFLGNAVDSMVVFFRSISNAVTAV